MNKRIRTPLKTETVQNYKMLIAGRERILPEVVFTISPFDDKEKGISAEEYKRIYAIISKDILAKLETPLKYEELEVLRKHFQVTQAEVAKVLGVDESTVSKWRKAHGDMDLGYAQLLKKFFADKMIRRSANNSESPYIVVISVTINGESHPIPRQGNVVSNVYEAIINAVESGEHSASYERVKLERFLSSSYDHEIATIHTPEVLLFGYEKIDVDDYVQEG